MNRTVLIVAAAVFAVVLGGFAALGLSAHPPVPQPVHRDLPLAAPATSAAAPSVAVPAAPPAPVVSAVVPPAPAQPTITPAAPPAPPAAVAPPAPVAPPPPVAAPAPAAPAHP